MIVLADNDILLKLARCDLFQEFFEAFNLRPGDIRILKTARFSTKSNKHRRKLGEEAFARLATFLNQVADIDAIPDQETIAALTDQNDKNIDAGEAVLFAVCPLIPESFILTGDKKSLVGLASAAKEDAACRTIAISLAGRVICFEIVLMRVLNRFGFEAIRQKLIVGRECDGGLAI